MERERISDLLRAGGFDPEGPTGDVRGTGDPIPSRFHTSEVAAVALAQLGRGAADLWRERGGEAQSVSVDVRAAGAFLVSFALQRLESGRDVARSSPPTTGIYETRDGRWIQLHGGYPHLSDGLLALLACELDAEAIAAAVRRWDGDELEEGIAARGLCGALVRSAEEWAGHPQGRALANAPLVSIRRLEGPAASRLPPADRPLGGVRVLDLTRVLAGPSCGRALASFGAEVLRIDAPHLPFIEPFLIDTGPGKRNAFLDLRETSDRERLHALLAEADVLVQSYRPGALAKLGLDVRAAARLRPGVVYVSLSCYGSAGPWANRPGWEQLAQAVSGIAHRHAGDRLEGAARLEGSPTGDGRPQIIPAAFNDFTTGSLAAWGAIEALRRRDREGGSWLVEVSLARTAQWLVAAGERPDTTAAPLGDLGDLLQESDSDWGRLWHLRPPIRMSLTPPHWARGPAGRGTSAPEWETVR